MSFRIETKKIFHVECDHCSKKTSFTQIRVVREIRAYGWALSKDYKKCYCPDCAPKFRNVGQAYNGICSWR